MGSQTVQRNTEMFSCKKKFKSKIDEIPEEFFEKAYPKNFKKFEELYYRNGDLEKMDPLRWG